MKTFKLADILREAEISKEEASEEIKQLVNEGLIEIRYVLTPKGVAACKKRE